MTQHKRRKLAIFVIFMTLMAATSYTVYAYETGQFWSRLNNTIVLTNTTNNVFIGENSTTSYRLEVNGSTKINGALNVSGNTRIYGPLEIYNTSYFNNDLWAYNRVFITGNIVTIGNYINISEGQKIYYGNREVALLPKGSIQMWSGLTIPYGWTLCDGSGGTPDLSGRFIIGINSTYSLNDTGGRSTVNLTDVNNGPHTHTYNAFGAGTLITIGAGTRGQVTANTGSSGLGRGFSIINPYYALAYIMFTGY